MQPDDGQSDFFSDFTDLDLVRHLLADVHEDLEGKIARSRQLLDLSHVLGSSGTLLFGGETTAAAWREARWSFIHGNFVATVLLCQGLAENLLASFLTASLSITRLPKRIAFAETLARCKEQGIITDHDMSDLKRLMALRNPLSHFRDLADDDNLSRRVLSTMAPAVEHLRSDATFAIGLAVRLLSLPAFRLGR